MTASAILLVGPTGSGKSPLGDTLQEKGLHGVPCAHFDFGSHLRAVALAREQVAGLSAGDRDSVRSVVRSGVLLEDGQFHIARAILSAFFVTANVDERTLVVLNGLPRHIGQARDLRSIVSVQGVVTLECPAAVVLERIHTNAGRDRTRRIDDDLEAVQARLETFRQETIPMLDHYRAEGVTLMPLAVGPRTTGRDLWRELAATGLFAAPDDTPRSS